MLIDAEFRILLSHLDKFISIEDLHNLVCVGSIVDQAQKADLIHTIRASQHAEVYSTAIAFLVIDNWGCHAAKRKVISQKVVAAIDFAGNIALITVE